MTTTHPRGPRGLRCPSSVSTWPDLIRFIRSKHTLTQGALGTACGVDEQAVRSWETEDRLPSNRLIHQVIAELASAWFSVEEVRALSKGAYLDPPKRFEAPQEKKRGKKGKIA